VAQPPRTSALSQRLDVQRLGFAVRYPASWSASENAGVVSIVNAPQARAAGRALETMPQILVTTETRRDHADAVSRLREIASEYPGPVTYTTISGWPAMQRRVVTTKEQAGAEEKDDRPDQKIVKFTTAIAAGNILIRADGRMPPTAGAQIESQVRAIEAGMVLRTPGNAAATARDLRLLRATPKLSLSKPPASKVRPAAPRQNLALARGPRRFAATAGTSASPATMPAAPFLQPWPRITRHSGRICERA
jgi:hypothetical protein